MLTMSPTDGNTFQYLSVLVVVQIEQTDKMKVATESIIDTISSIVALSRRNLSFVSTNGEKDVDAPKYSRWDFPGIRITMMISAGRLSELLGSTRNNSKQFICFRCPSHQCPVPDTCVQEHIMPSIQDNGTMQQIQDKTQEKFWEKLVKKQQYQYVLEMRKFSEKLETNFSLFSLKYLMENFQKYSIFKWIIRIVI